MKEALSVILRLPSSYTQPSLRTVLREQRKGKKGQTFATKNVTCSSLGCHLCFVCSWREEQRIEPLSEAELVLCLLLQGPGGSLESTTDSRNYYMFKYLLPMN